MHRTHSLYCTVLDGWGVGVGWGYEPVNDCVCGTRRRHWISVSLWVCVVCVCTGSRLVRLLPWGLRAHFLLCIVISFPVRSSQHHYISDKLHCKFSRPLAQRSIWDWFRMPCWAELEDQFEMDCSRQGANDTQCSAHLLSLLCFLHSSLSLTFISFSPYIFLFHLLLSLSVVSHLSCSVVTLSYPVCLSPFCINSYSFLRFSPLLPASLTFHLPASSRQ